MSPSSSTAPPWQTCVRKRVQNKCYIILYYIGTYFAACQIRCPKSGCCAAKRPPSFLPNVNSNHALFGIFCWSKNFLNTCKYGWAHTLRTSGDLSSAPLHRSSVQKHCFPWSVSSQEPSALLSFLPQEETSTPSAEKSRKHIKLLN